MEGVGCRKNIDAGIEEKEKIKEEDRRESEREKKGREKRTEDERG